MRRILDATYETRNLRRLYVERWALYRWTVLAFVWAIVMGAISQALGAALFFWHLCGDFPCAG